MATMIDETPTKKLEEFRNYSDGTCDDLVRKHYKAMRENQCVAYVDRMHNKYNFNSGHFRKMMTIKEAFETLESYVDSSDPDITLPNIVHMMQTAEGIRRDGHDDWFQLVGLIHDMGKILFAIGGIIEDGQEGTATVPQWGLGGDTWIVGCQIPDCVVFPEFNVLNPDRDDPGYNTPLGIYEQGCGLDNCKFAYGHDEYLYQFLVSLWCSPSTFCKYVHFSDRQ